MKIKMHSLNDTHELKRIDPELMRLASSYAKQRAHTELKARTGSFKPVPLPQMDRATYIRLFHFDNEQIVLPAEPPVRDLMPVEALGAALIGVAGTNDELQSYQIFSILHTVERPHLDTGFLFYEHYKLEDLFDRMHLVLSGPQRLAVITNVLDFAMGDGYYRSNERRFIRLLREQLQVDEQSYDEIYRVMMLKHDLGVFA